VRATKKGERVAVTTMTFIPDEPLIGALMDELGAAARRGVHTYLTVDAYTFLLDAETKLPGPLWFSNDLDRNIKQPYRRWRDVLRNLQKQGVQVAITNRPQRAFSLPQAGRSHIKMAIVDDKLYVGGCNLYGPDEISLMVQFESKKTADWLFPFVQKMAETGQTSEVFKGKDLMLQIDDKTELLLDAGVRGQSIIYERALQMVNEARDWLVFTCQYLPHGVTADHLVAALRRGVEVKILFNNPREHGPIEGALEYAARFREKLRLPKSFFAGELPKGAPYLHGKLLASEGGAMVGSHNYVTTGVRLGTPELALLRRDRDFAQNLADFITQQLS
jgi:phosphatidylserine/phosphatidylglycerophosphate/cardiolipin synthase-like enzyme